jgi:hypothetical protein
MSRAPAIDESSHTCVAAGRFGCMVALQRTEIVESVSPRRRAPKLLDPKLYETAELFFG